MGEVLVCGAQEELILTALARTLDKCAFVKS